MLNSIITERNSVKSKTAVTVLGVVMCVLLPQFFHVLGAASGMGNALGVYFLPMYLPVLFVGLFSGSLAGTICGIISPFISSVLTNMPTPAVLPFMMLELCVFGFAAGMFSKTNMPMTLKVILTQIVGRGARMLSALFAVYALGGQISLVSQTLSLLVQGLPGIVLQLAFLPLIMYRLDNMND